MVDFTQTIRQSSALSEAQQRKVGQPVAAKMTTEHEDFIKTILALIERKEIDLQTLESFLKMEVYNALDDAWKAKVDIALVNIANLLTHIVEFRKSKFTPDESPELESMIEHLWQMKQRIEETYDVFKF